ncbi:unnamed protein product [Vitrella brassicaformis CCMP3155]|uniref:Uncharacterized protein n=1 Tax=Vitrella brassicaformis (strain CCMP3155) TaxID=1169540 RepID=A0A0G4FIJ5_VITBC|nr:unnamed protein product [Vitrella brassicaformis CCMP3155]|eukprot:CEM12932.1 unnamed protein product [Vitrella brassicaformis CCMP3155]
MKDVCDRSGGAEVTRMIQVPPTWQEPQFVQYVKDLFNIQYDFLVKDSTDVFTPVASFKEGETYFIERTGTSAAAAADTVAASGPSQTPACLTPSALAPSGRREATPGWGILQLWPRPLRLQRVLPLS